MQQQNFLDSILAALEKAKEPLFFGGIICVLLIGFVLFYYRKGARRHLAVEIITYGILFVGVISVMVGLYLKVNPNAKVIYGMVYFDCEPANDVDVFTARLRLARTDLDGSFHFDISGLYKKELRLTFMKGGKWIGDTILPVEAFEDELKIRLGDCSDFVSKTVKGRVFNRVDNTGIGGLSVSFKGYDYRAITASDGSFTLKADSLLKRDLSEIEIHVTGEYEGTWPLSTFKGEIPVDKKN